MKKYRAVAIANAISDDSALKKARNFCSASRILNSFFDFSFWYLSLSLVKKAFSLINICNFGNRLNLIKKIPHGHDRVRGNFEQIEEFGCLFNYTICVLCILLFGLLPKLQNMIFEHFFFRFYYFYYTTQS